MPRRNDVQTVLVLGAGPAGIGQGSEFDFAALEALQALKALGYRTVAISSNPADAMVDQECSDAAYIEPLNVRSVSNIIAREKPQACLPTVGGRMGLKLILELEREGVLNSQGIQVIGVGVETIAACKDRAQLYAVMQGISVDMPRSVSAVSVEDAEKAAKGLGYPVVVRSSHTLGGEGSVLAYNSEELRMLVGRGISMGVAGPIIMEESLVGWEKFQLEVLRDALGITIAVGLIENVDPLGIHSGDSIAVMPMLTVAPELRERLSAMAAAIVSGLNIVGIANIQFAHDAETDRIVALEINPRFSRSSAFVAAMTGLPLGAIAARLAVGVGLKEMSDIFGPDPAAYIPAVDLVAVRLPRFQFERFHGAEDRLSTRMQSVGEVIGLGASFKEALQKAVAALDGDAIGLGDIEPNPDWDEQRQELSEPSSARLSVLYAALAGGAGVDELSQASRIKPWFIVQLKELADLSQAIRACRGQKIPDALLVQAKQNGFSDRTLATMLELDEDEVRRRWVAQGIKKSFRRIRHAPWYYSTFEPTDGGKVQPSPTRKGIMLLGGGPARIGQGQESDYACRHAGLALEDLGYAPLLLNCNPAAIHGFTERCVYIEPLTAENILDAWQHCQPEGLIFQFGGHTAAKAAAILSGKQDLRLFGTSLSTVALAADRVRLREKITGLGIPMPASGIAHTVEEAVSLAEQIGFPVVIRPLSSIDGLGMQVVHDAEMLKASPSPYPMLIYRFLENAIVAEADALSDGHDTVIPAIMEHVELAGVHAGDCAGVIPPISIPVKHIDLMHSYIARIARELGIRGLMNVQFAISNDMLYCLGVSPRSSRSVPLIAKACRIPLVEMAVSVILGRAVADVSLAERDSNRFCVKEAVFPFSAFPDVDPVLGPEMHATGMVMGEADSFGLAYYKAVEAAGLCLPDSGTLLISVSRRERPAVLAVASLFANLGFAIKATRGTQRFLKEHGIEAKVVFKLHEGRPNIVDDIKNNVYGLIINTPDGKLGAFDDSYIRKAAIRYHVPYITTLSGAIAAARGIEAYRRGQAAHGAAG